MKKTALSITFFMLMTSSAFAMQTGNKSEKVLKEFGATFAVSAGRMQWQQLWQKTREAGALEGQGNQPRFTVSMQQLPDIVSSTLSSATTVEAKLTHLAVYRRDFSPHAVGVIENQNVSSICVTVDWKAIGETTLPSDVNEVMNARFVVALPCK